MIPRRCPSSSPSALKPKIENVIMASTKLSQTQATAPHPNLVYDWLSLSTFTQTLGRTIALPYLALSSD